MGFVFLAIVIVLAVIAISNQLREPQGRPHFKLGADGVPHFVEYRNRNQ